MKPENICRCQNILGEGPLWNAQEQAIYWVDIDAKKDPALFPGNQEI